MKFKKVFIAVALFLKLISIESSHAFSCDQSLLNNAQTASAIQFLKNYEGTFKLGSCVVELHVCKTDEKLTTEQSNIAADMLIIDKSGFQRYIPFFVQEFKNRWSKQVWYLSPNVLVYRFNDKNFDNETGSDERWDIEFVKKDNEEKLDYLEVGYSSEVERDNSTNKKWIICGAEREAYQARHPYKHKLKSIIWWLTHPNGR